MQCTEVLVLLPPFLGPGFRLGARWNRLVETVKTRKKREKTGEKWARYGLRSVNKEGTGGITCLRIPAGCPPPTFPGERRLPGGVMLVASTNALAEPPVAAAVPCLSKVGSRSAVVFAPATTARPSGTRTQRAVLSGGRVAVR